MSTTLERRAERPSEVAPAVVSASNSLPSRRGRREWWIPLASCLAVLGPAVAISVATGSISIAHNDDWGYRRPALSLYEHGHFALVGWAQVTLVAQVLWTWPFWILSRQHEWSFAVSTVVAACLGACALYGLARSALRRSEAIFVLFTALLVPGFALSATTYMTDVPAWSASMVTLWAGGRALRSTGRRRLIWFAAALFTGVFGFGAREAVIAALIAVIVVGARRSARRAELALIIGGGALALAACVAIYYLSSHLANTSATIFHPLGIDVLARQFTRALATAAFMLVPVTSTVILRNWREILGRHAAQIGGLLGVLVALADVRFTYSPTAGITQSVFIGNYLTPSGVTGNSVLEGVRAEAFSPLLWDGLSALGLASLVLLGLALGAAAVGRGERVPRARPDGTMQICLIFVAIYSASVAAFAYSGQGIDDRYLFPLVGPAAIVLVAVARRGHQMPSNRAAYAIPAISVLVIAAVSLILTANADAFDAARWRAGNALVAEGIPAPSIDAGFEWVGMHQVGAVGRGSGGSGIDETWYDALFPALRVCGTVSSQPITASGYVPAGTVSYATWAALGHATLYLYRVEQSGCPSTL